MTFFHSRALSNNSFDPNENQRGFRRQLVSGAVDMGTFNSGIGRENFLKPKSFALRLSYEAIG